MPTKRNSVCVGFDAIVDVFCVDRSLSLREWVSEPVRMFIIQNVWYHPTAVSDTMSKHRVVHPLRRTLSHPSLADSISDGWNSSSMDGNGSEGPTEHTAADCNRSSSSRCSTHRRRASVLSESISNTTSNHAHKANQSNPSATEPICKLTTFNNTTPAVILLNKTSDPKKSPKPRFDSKNFVFFFLLCIFLLSNMNCEHF